VAPGGAPVAAAWFSSAPGCGGRGEELEGLKGEVMSDAEQRELLRLENRLLEVLTDVARLRIRMSKGSARVAVDASPEAPVPMSADMAVPTDLIDLAAAAKLAHRPKDTIRSWCRENRVGDPGGFGFKVASTRWMVSRKPFLDFIRR
jgi:hypothetical protein